MTDLETLQAIGAIIAVCWIMITILCFAWSRQ